MTTFRFIFLFVAVSVMAQQPPKTANSDENYRALRDGAAGESLRVENIVLKRDAGTITLRSGSISFLPAVLGKVSIGVFTGEGKFQLKPAVMREAAHLMMMIEKPEVDEEIETAVLYFTDETYEEIKKSASAQGDGSRAARALQDVHDRLRKDISELDEDSLNIEAELLGELYNPKQRGSFRAFLRGKKYKDLRFFVVPGGAWPSLPSPEEVGLMYADWNNDRAGIWYLSSTETKLKNGGARMDDYKRLVDAEHYTINTTLARGGRITASADVKFRALEDGVRVVPFGLVPTLRVSKVTGEGGKELSFIQEKQKEDASFFVILPEPAAKEKSYTVHVEYGGDKVVSSEGGGSFAVRARTSWYPSLNSFADRATYDLTFKVPRQFMLVSVGQQIKEAREGDLTVTQWKSDVPLGVAGFNYGQFVKKQMTDEATKYGIETYATRDAPDILRSVSELQLAPSALAEKAMVEAQNSIRIFQNWFGAAPYGRIAITQQPQMSFGQSWPSLVYLPIISFLDATQRWSIFQQNSFDLNDFIQEVTPHEVAHQWWGHIVGWASYRDQWLSEGFADFSASLYLQAVDPKNDKFLKFWDNARRTILEKNQYGFAANDVGPLSMGLRLNTARGGRAYSKLVYPKGAYVLHMLRMMMREDRGGDKAFIAMMQDFVKTYTHRNASTESFQEIVEKHMTPAMDLEGNRKMDWFFREWVHGKEIPKYRMDYSYKQGAGEKVVLVMKITQSDVSPNFLMRVPVYVDFDGRLSKMGSLSMKGSDTSPPIEVELPRKPRRVLLNAYHDILAAEAVVKEM